MDGFGGDRKIESGLTRAEFDTDINHVLILEQDVTPEIRREIGTVLPPEWFREDGGKAQEIRERGWFQAEPYARLLTYDGKRIVGQGALIDLTTDESPVAVRGLADVVLLPEYRKQGIGGELLRRSVAEARTGRQVGAIMAATVVRPVLHTLEGMGFRDARPNEFFFWLDDHPGMRGAPLDVIREEWHVFPDRSVYNRDWRVLTSGSFPEGQRVRIKHDF